MDEVLSRLALALPRSLRALTRGGANQLEAYALCTDADFRTLYGAGYRLEDAMGLAEPQFRFLPAEWPLEEYSEIGPASDALGKWMNANYHQESDDGNPGDDHLRPWKRRMFEGVIEVIVDLKRSGSIPSQMAFWLTCHDPNDAMVDWIRAGVSRLNSEDTFKSWSEAWAYWYR